MRVNIKTNVLYHVRKIYVIILFAMALMSCKSKSHYADPLSPEESLKTFHFAGEFKAEIFATEPLVIDPVSMEFDEEGNAYVVGMLDAYKPDSVKGKGKIVLLKDQNDDGRADTAITFADSIREASSILPWEGGLLIAAAPNIMYYKDTDGDGRADVKEILFSGFFANNEEAQITNLRFGVDNWIYANNAGYAGEITFSRMPNSPKLVMEGADFRFRLDRNQFETTTGPGQFGLAIDDWGHRFFTQNTLHIRQAVITRRYILRQPFLPSNATTSVVNVSDHDLLMYQLTDAPYWRQVRTDRRNKEFKENNVERVEYAKDHFTAASGGTFYGGDVLGKEFYGNIFTGDVSGNLVHRDVLTSNDSFPYSIAKRAPEEKDKEFLASTDPWFRPTSCAVGPDGFLYIIDMYRQHIETPRAIPVDLQADMDFNAGDKYGRIYRVSPKNAAPYKKIILNLRSAKSADLVAMLSHQNQWWRLQAQRLLLERQDKSVIPAVKKLFAQADDARFRLHALYVLEAMNALDAGIVKAALRDPSPGIRENGAILSERYAACLPDLEALVNDSSIRVAFQATLSLGEYKGKSVDNVMAKALDRYGYSPSFRTAVLSSNAGSSIHFLEALERGSFFRETAPWKLMFIESFSNIIGSRNQKAEITSLLKKISQGFISGIPDFQIAGIKGLAQALLNHEELQVSLKEKLKKIESEPGRDVSGLVEELMQYYADASKK